MWYECGVLHSSAKYKRLIGDWPHAAQISTCFCTAKVVLNADFFRRHISWRNAVALSASQYAVQAVTSSCSSESRVEHREESSRVMRPFGTGMYRRRSCLSAWKTAEETTSF